MLEDVLVPHLSPTAHGTHDKLAGLCSWIARRRRRWLRGRRRWRRWRRLFWRDRQCTLLLLLLLLLLLPPLLLLLPLLFLGGLLRLLLLLLLLQRRPSFIRNMRGASQLGQGPGARLEVIVDQSDVDALATTRA